jgi:hypothetical protein
MSRREQLLNLSSEEKVRLWELHKKMEKTRTNLVFPSQLLEKDGITEPKIKNPRKFLGLSQKKKDAIEDSVNTVSFFIGLSIFLISVSLFFIVFKFFNLNSGWYLLLIPILAAITQAIVYTIRILITGNDVSNVIRRLKTNSAIKKEEDENCYINGLKFRDIEESLMMYEERLALRTWDYLNEISQFELKFIIGESFVRNGCEVTYTKYNIERFIDCILTKDGKKVALLCRNKSMGISSTQLDLFQEGIEKEGLDYGIIVYTFISDKISQMARHRNIETMNLHQLTELTHTFTFYHKIKRAYNIQ